FAYMTQAVLLLMAAVYAGIATL
ncbi:MAG: hypothetical protein RLZZ536_809, partial [Planctomycetota bacterium]